MKKIIVLFIYTPILFAALREETIEYGDFPDSHTLNWKQRFAITHKVTLWKSLKEAAELEIKNHRSADRLIYAIKKLLTVHTNISDLPYEYMFQMVQENVHFRTDMLCLAVENNLKAVAQLALYYKADINARDRETKLSLLLLALARGHCELAQFLLEKGTQFDPKSQETIKALHTFVTASANDYWDGKIQRIQFLLEKGVDVNSVDSQGFTLLHKAVIGREPRKQVVNLLLHYGAQVNAVSNDGKTVLESLNWTWSGDIVTMLLPHSTDINQRDSKGFTPLHKAAQQHFPQIKIIQRLLELGADIEARTPDGKTASDILESHDDLCRVQDGLNTLKLLLQQSTKKRTNNTCDSCYKKIQKDPLFCACDKKLFCSKKCLRNAKLHKSVCISYAQRVPEKLPKPYDTSGHPNWNALSPEQHKEYYARVRELFQKNEPSSAQETSQTFISPYIPDIGCVVYHPSHPKDSQ